MFLTSTEKLQLLNWLNTHFEPAETKPTKLALSPVLVFILFYDLDLKEKQLSEDKL